MKKPTFILSGMLAGLLLVGAGCDQSSPPATTADTKAPAAASNWPAVAADSSNAWQNIKQGGTQVWYNAKAGTFAAWSDIQESIAGAADDTYERKDEFVTRAQADLDKLDRKIEQWSDQAASAGDAVQTDAQVKLQQLKTQRAVLQQKMDAVKAATEANWNDAKAGFKQAYDEAKTSMKTAWDWLRGKMS